MDVKRRKFLSLLGLAGSVAIPAEIVRAQSSNLDNPTIQPTDSLDVRQYGAKGDGLTNDTQAVVNALNVLKQRGGGTLLFPATQGPGYLLIDLVIAADNITLDGSGTLLVRRGINLKCSNFTARNLKLKAPEYSAENRGFRCIANENSNATPPAYSKLTFENLQFFGFFYSTDLRAIDYSGPRNDTDGTISEITIRGCRSEATAGRDAGHFQHIGVTNVSLTGNRTFGGKGASSYNFINANGTITVANNFDENNLYSSCEIENSSNQTIIMGNHFGNNIWIDDSRDAIISGNIAKRIDISIQTAECDTVSIVNNHCESIYLHYFSSDPKGKIRNVNIQSNILRHQEPNPRSWAILVQQVENGIIAHNMIIGGPNKYINAVALDHSRDVVIAENMTQGSSMKDIYPETAPAPS